MFVPLSSLVRDTAVSESDTSTDPGVASFTWLPERPGLEEKLKQ
jgi:hypothetical protein